MEFGTCSPYISTKSLEKRVIALCISREVLYYPKEFYVGDYQLTSSDELKIYLKNKMYSYYTF